MLVNTQKIVSISEEEKLDEIADRILFENLEAFKELAKSTIRFM